MLYLGCSPHLFTDKHLWVAAADYREQQDGVCPWGDEIEDAGKDDDGNGNRLTDQSQVFLKGIIDHDTTADQQPVGAIFFTCGSSLYRLFGREPVGV